MPAYAEARSADPEIREIGTRRHPNLGERDARRKLLRRQIAALIQLEIREHKVRSAADGHVVVDLVGDRRLQIRSLQQRLVRDEASGELHRPLDGKAEWHENS